MSVEQLIYELFGEIREEECDKYYTVATTSAQITSAYEESKH